MKRTDPLDAVIGDRIRALRMARGLAQNQLAAMIGASVHDVELFEMGVKRIGASRLMNIAKVLHVDIGALFGNWDAFEETVASPDVLGLTLYGGLQSPSRSIH